MREFLDKAGARLSEKGLLRFDYRALVLCLAVLLLFILSVAFRLHGSSISYWYTLLPQAREEKTGVLFGGPESIRSDEWLVTTPFIVSQYRHDYPVSNPAIGANKDPLIAAYNLPARHFSNLFKPQSWGYFALGLERGFSFYWSFKLFGFFLVSFLLFMLLTRNRFWLSVFGAVWLLFSGFTQWWFSTVMIEMMTSAFIAFIAAAYILLSARRAFVAVAAALLLIFSLDFAFFFYPPFQVTLGWLMLFLFVGFMLGGGRLRTARAKLGSRLPVLGAVAVAALAVMFAFYGDARGTIEAMANTAYPGRRVLTGGDTGLVKMFSGFSEAPFSELDYPAIWSNASETSNFILLFPAVFAAWFWNFTRRVRSDPMVTSLLVFLFLVSAWLLVEFPSFLARATLMSNVPSNRAVLALGVGSILLTVVFLSQRNVGNSEAAEDAAGARLAREAGASDVSSDSRYARGVSALALALLVLFGLYFNQRTDDFLRYRYIVLLAVFFAVVTWALLRKKAGLFTALILIALYPYYFVNPVAYGLDPILKNSVVLEADQLSQEQPGARWAVYGKSNLSALLKAGGLDVINGVTYTQDLDLYSRLAGGVDHSQVYNRYAHVYFLEPDRPGAAPRFDLTYIDTFDVYVSPCDPRLEELGVDNFVFTGAPGQDSLSCLELIEYDQKNRVGFYRRARG